MLEPMGEMCWQVGRKMDCELLEFSGESDHVHLLIDFHPCGCNFGCGWFLEGSYK